jgi:polyhydroxyalkanoate synthesis regulator phasin
MPASKSSSGSSPSSSRSQSTTIMRREASDGASTRVDGPGRETAGTTQPTRSAGATVSGIGDSLATLAEQLINRVIKPLDLVLLTRERIQETLDEAAERGRVTRSDANELVSELVRRGRQQTDDVFRDLELLLERGRDQLESATRRARSVDSVDRLVRGADLARRSIDAGPSFPIAGYDGLTARQVGDRLKGLTPGELRRVRDYERRHANRKSVLAAIEKALA